MERLGIVLERHGSVLGSFWERLVAFWESGDFLGTFGGQPKCSTATPCMQNSVRNTPKIEVWKHLEAFLDTPWGVLGRLGGRRKSYGGRRLSWGRLGVILGCLEASWDRLVTVLCFLV